MKKTAVLSVAVLSVLCTGCMGFEKPAENLFSDADNHAETSYTTAVSESKESMTFAEAETSVPETTAVSAETTAPADSEKTEESSETEKKKEIHFNDDSKTETSASSSNENQGADVPHPAPNIYGYTPAFYQLTSDEQTAYDELVRGLASLREEIEISVSLDSDQISKVYDAVLVNMEQQLYAPVRQYTVMTYEATGKVHSVKPNYSCDAARLANIEKAVRSAAESILSGITDGMSKVDKIKHIHDSIILNCEYSNAGRESGNAYGALVEGRAICEGYSRAMSYICKKAGINCEIITGTADNVSHMWNMVEVDGKWYNIDLTWDDPIFSNSTEDYISYAYFNVTDADISGTHSPDTSVFSYPVSYASDANYFVYYNRYISSTDECSDVIYRGIAEAAGNSENFAVFKFADKQVFEDSTAFLFDDTWSGFFSVVDEYNQENDSKIDKNSISVKKDIANYIIRITLSDLYS